MDEVKKFFEAAYADAKALKAKLAADIEALEQKFGFDPSTLELTDAAPQDQAPA